MQSPQTIKMAKLGENKNHRNMWKTARGIGQRMCAVNIFKIGTLEIKYLIMGDLKCRRKEREIEEPILANFVKS